jgi:hypothetical protein
MDTYTFSNLCLFAFIRGLKKKAWGLLIGISAPAFSVLFVLTESYSSNIKMTKQPKKSIYDPGCFFDPFLLLNLSCFLLIPPFRFYDLYFLSGFLSGRGQPYDPRPASYPGYGLCIKIVACQYPTVCPHYL